MYRTSKNPQIYELEQRVLHYANYFNRDLPEIRFFILDGMEFASLLEKNVYPTSPINIWEGKRMSNKRHRIETGQESSLYYEVVQTGNPSYAYLNINNSLMMQASVMAHVVGHCEFSKLNVLKDMTDDRTEWVMHLVKKVNLYRNKVGENNFTKFWNAAESVANLIAPHSQYNLEGSIETDSLHYDISEKETNKQEETTAFSPFSYTMEKMLQPLDKEESWEKEQNRKNKEDLISRQGYRLKAPCQDILGFLRRYAPTSPAEKSILDYLYTVNYPHDFVIRTQIMNEGWAMYWEKKIMLELFKEKAVTGIIDYSKIFSAVCYPRPYYIRNPYHLGFHLWEHIETLYKEGKVNLHYFEETNQSKRENWNQPIKTEPIKKMEHLVRTITDYEFLRRFLTIDLIQKYHLNRVPREHTIKMMIHPDQVIDTSEHFIWLDPEPLKDQMLDFFTHFYYPRIYLIDTDFMDGGLLLFHRNDGRSLKTDWIQPTLKNISMIWKGGVSLISQQSLYTYTSFNFKESPISELSFETILYRLSKSKKPLP